MPQSLEARVGLSRELGGPVFLGPENLERIAGRQDEAHRQRQLKP